MPIVDTMLIEYAILTNNKFTTLLNDLQEEVNGVMRRHHLRSADACLQRNLLVLIVTIERNPCLPSNKVLLR